ncbi:MAG: TadE/TadG family type IV pilus assembly protein [Stackebrandtia sp.]
MRKRDERGASAVFVLLIAVALMSCAGLVIDGGYALAGSRRLTGQAQQAARIASDALNEDSLRDGDGDVSVVRAKASAAASAYLSQVGAPSPSISINGGEVTVVLTDAQPTAILSVVGVGSLPIRGEGTAVSIDADGIGAAP